MLKIEGVVLSDQNAASKYVRFLAPQDIDTIDFNMVFAESWVHSDNQITYWQHKAAKCAEVLVPHCVPLQLIFGAYVTSKQSKEKLESQDFVGEIIERPHLFFL